MAATFHEWDVGAMKRTLTAKEFMEWEAYAQMEPWTFYSELRADWRAASIRETIFNVAVEKKYRRPTKDFLLPFEEEQKPKRRQTPEEQFQLLKVLSIMHNTAATTSPES